MKYLHLTFLLLFLSFSVIRAQQQVIPLWPGVPPGSENWTQKEVLYQNDQKQQMVRNVVTPTLTVYKPDPAKVNGTAIIVAPGGGFRWLSWQTEGTEVAEYLVAKGVTVFVLKYRLMDTGATPEEFQKATMALYKQITDASNPDNTNNPERNINKSSDMTNAGTQGQEDGRQAIRIVRSRAAEWGIKPNQIGMIGFSAGGMVTLGPCLQSDKESQLDFAGLIYTPWSGGTVPVYAPPLFVLVAGDDGLAAPGSLKIYSAWKAAGKEAELHIYSKGQHGFGMQKKGLPVDSWIERFGDWLAMYGLISKK